MGKPLDQQTIVITGASSGMGLAMAEHAAAAGARLVIVGRDGEALEAIAQRLRGRAEVLAVAADVGVREQVDTVARAAIERFGGFDTWINNAGVGLVGSVLDGHDEATARRLVDTNFWGTVHGSLAAAAHLRRKGGTLINMASMTADHGVPLQAIYSASKHAVKGFSDALRQELLAEGSTLSVVVVKPAAMATPLVEHVAHPAGPRPRLPSPLYDPHDAARAILAAAENPPRELEIGGMAVMNGIAAAVAPALMDVASPWLAGSQLRDEQCEGSNGNLFTPSRDSHGRTLGNHPGQRVMPSVYNRMLGPLQSLPARALGAVSSAASLLSGSRRGRR